MTRQLGTGLLQDYREIIDASETANPIKTLAVPAAGMQRPWRRMWAVGLAGTDESGWAVAATAHLKLNKVALCLGITDCWSSGANS